MPASPQNIGLPLRWLGALSRGTPYFKGKWRLIDWLFHRWLKKTGYSEVIEFNRGITIRCNLWDEVQNGIWWGGTNYERRESLYMRKVFQPGIVFLDVGANIGYYSLLAVSELAGDISVHAFEPVSRQHAGFCENIERNRIRNIRLNKLIVSDTCARQAIHLGESWNSGSASISTTYDGSTDVEEVDSITLDAYCRQQNLSRVDVIKIDVEGHEMSVLKAATEVLAKFRPILFIEVRDANLRDARSSREALYAFLAAAGYQPFAITPNIELRPIQSPVDGSLIVFKPAAVL